VGPAPGRSSKTGSRVAIRLIPGMVLVHSNAVSAANKPLQALEADGRAYVVLCTAPCRPW
jgi:hypothetical protein